MTLTGRLRTWARRMKREVIALALAARHPRTPWYAKLLLAAIVAYALSPIDLIPEFVPVLGYLDDLVIIPAGIALAVRLVPAADVMDECRRHADRSTEPPWGVIGAVIVVAVWLLSIVVAVWWFA